MAKSEGTDGPKVRKRMILNGSGKLLMTMKRMSEIVGGAVLSVVQTDGSWTRDIMAEGGAFVSFPPVCISVEWVVDQRLQVAHQ